MASLELRKNWILGGYTSVLESTTTLSDLGLSSLTDGLLRTLLPALDVEGERSEILDFKGRNPLDQLVPGPPPAQKDELFRVGGQCAVEEVKDGFEWEDFDICCYSPFARFEGTHHIVHSLEIQRSGALPAWLPPRLLGCAAPVKVHYLRFALEHFRSRRTFASLGYAPQIAESLLIDCHGTTLTMRLTIESGKRQIEDPFEITPALRIAAEVIHQSCGVDIKEEYMHLLRQNW
jgi:hypothetical protein